ncbi:YceI family protein [Primorskyibacter sp. S87]|uniref:YceI family protein n=1 Tax=Primorskyibacter sp. S87 TaxID=3415126 RepID=UPI003C7C6D18
MPEPENEQRQARRQTPTRRTLLVALAALPVMGLSPIRPLAAAQRRYVLDPDASSVGFRFTLGGVAQSGTMPVDRADIHVDPTNLAASRVDVTLGIGKARTGMVMASQAMKGPTVLNTDSHPTARFVSTRIKLAPDGRLSGGATITGDLTLRGVTRPLTLNAGLFRPQGSQPDDLSRLTVRLTGKLSRSAFGAAGFPDMVADTVELDITAAIRAAN